MTDRKRRPRGQLLGAIREHLESLGGEPATIAEITSVIEPQIGEVPKSSVRATLQNQKYFIRVSRGVFRMRGSAE